MISPRRFLAAAFLAFGLAGGSGMALASPPLVQEKQCGACHRFAPDEAEKPAPDLYYAGDKFKKSWLENFLQKPDTIRLAGTPRDPGFLKGQPEFKGPHPSLAPEEAKPMADYLSTLKILKDTPPLKLEPLSKGERARVKILFERDLSCIACHQSYNLARQPRGGVSGPSLVDAGNRLKPEWVYQWLKNPEPFARQSRMPRYALDEETLNKLTSYILSHTREGSKP